MHNFSAHIIEQGLNILHDSLVNTKFTQKKEE